MYTKYSSKAQWPISWDTCKDEIYNHKYPGCVLTQYNLGVWSEEWIYNGVR